jgi:hypothetical protein
MDYMAVSRKSVELRCACGVRLDQGALSPEGGLRLGALKPNAQRTGGVGDLHAGPTRKQRSAWSTRYPHRDWPALASDPNTYAGLYEKRCRQCGRQVTLTVGQLTERVSRSIEQGVSEMTLSPEPATRTRSDPDSQHRSVRFRGERDGFRRLSRIRSR